MQYIEKLVLVTQVYSNNWKKSMEKTFADPVQRQGREGGTEEHRQLQNFLQDMPTQQNHRLP